MPKITVKIDEATVREDRSLSLTELSRIPSASRRAGMEAYDRTLGLTEADIGAKADPRRLAKAASEYENSVVRRLGYLLDRVGHKRQSKALEPFVQQAKTAVRLDPAVKPLFAGQETAHETDAKWKLEINEPVEIDF